jgi:hypothetical protein
MTITETSMQTGWYFYGITRDGPLEVPPASDSSSLQLLGFSGLAAVVRPVQRDDFSLEAIQERVKSASTLEAMVRSHNHVIEAIHARQPILPAKFGVVYADADDVVSALRSSHDTLRHQLFHIEGCDEWAVHLYADRAVFGERTSSEDPVIRRLRDEHAAARPGRAYFLQQQLRDELRAATEQALAAVAHRTFDRLARFAVASQMSEVEPATDSAGEAEILRSSFLVARDVAEQFREAVRATAGDGLRCDHSGPWPPYSFAARYEVEAE